MKYGTRRAKPAGARYRPRANLSSRYVMLFRSLRLIFFVCNILFTFSMNHIDFRCLRTIVLCCLCPGTSIARPDYRVGAWIDFLICNCGAEFECSILFCFVKYSNIVLTDLN